MTMHTLLATLMYATKKLRRAKADSLVLFSVPETRKFMNTRASAAKRETVHKRGGKTRSLVSFASVMERRDARQERTR